MAKPRDILVHVSIDQAVRKRKCHHSKKHGVSAGAKCLLVRERNNLGSKNYCADCAREILGAAGQKLAGLSQELTRSA